MAKSGKQKVWASTGVPCLLRYVKTGMYYARVKIHGQDKRFSLKTKDKAVAKRLLADQRTQLEERSPDSGTCTVGDLVERYKANLTSLAKSTQVARTGVLKKFERDFRDKLKQHPLKIRPSDLENWLALSTVGLSGWTQRLYRTVLQGVFDLAVRDRIITKSPAVELPKGKIKSPVRNTPEWDQFETIVENVRSQICNSASDESADFLEFLGRAGVGQAEAAALTWQDVDFERDQIHLLRKKTSRGYIIPLYPSVRPLLERRFKASQGKPTERVFTVLDCKKSLANACKRLGFPHYTQRSFRRCFTTRAVEQGIDFKVIAEWQGHSDGGALIAKVYSHLRPEHSHAMAAKIT